MRILIVEDSPKRVERIQEVISGHFCRVAHDVSSAISLLEEIGFDLVFLDYDLANGDVSTEVAVQIASNGNTGVVVTHSENPCGVQEIRAILSDSISLPFSELQGEGRSSNTLKKVLANPYSTVSDLMVWSKNLL